MVILIVVVMRGLALILSASPERFHFLTIFGLPDSALCVERAKSGVNTSLRGGLA